MRWLALAALGAAKSSQGGSSKCPDAKVWSGSGVVPLCKAHFPEAGAKNGWLILFTGEDMWQQRLIQEVRTTFVAASKEHKRTGEPKDLKFGGVSCYGENEMEFCKSRGAGKFPTVYYTDGSRVEAYPKTHADLRTVTVQELLSFAAKQQAEIGGVVRSGGACNMGIFQKDSEDYVVPLCNGNFPPQEENEPVPWVVAFYDKGSKHEDKALRVALNKLAKSYGHNARSKKKATKVSVNVGAVLCEKSKKLCAEYAPSGNTAIRFFRGGAATAEFESFVDIDEIKTWASEHVHLAAAETKQAVEEAEAEIQASVDPAALQEEMARLTEQKAAAVAAENFAEAKRIKKVLDSKEAQLELVRDSKGDDPAELEAELQKLRAEKAAAIAAEDFPTAKRLKSQQAGLEKRLAKVKKAEL